MFTKRELKTFLESETKNGRVAKLNFVSAENFVLVLKSNIDPEAGIPYFNKYFRDFVKKFAKFTSTTWIVRNSYPKALRFVYRKVYVCHLSSFNKKKILDPAKNERNSERNKQCTAKMDFKVKRINRNTMKNDPYIKQSLNLTILIKFEHSHVVRDREHFHLLRGCEESDTKIYEYFDRGFTAGTAKNYHQLCLIEQFGNDLERLSNSNINPTSSHFNYLYTKYRKERESEIRSVGTLMADKKTNLQNNGGTLIYTDNVEIALVITPFMKRVFLDVGSDALVVDSTLVNKIVWTFFYAPSKLGALPIACALHTSQDEENFTRTFLTVKITFEHNHFGRQFEPKLLVSNDSKELSKAVAEVFPQAKRALIPADICRNFWAWLSDDEGKCSRKKRHTLMILFRRMLYADSFEASELSYRELMEHAEENTRAYIEDVWSRRNEWVQSDLYEFSKKHVLDSSIIFIKELLIQRCNSFNVCMAVDALVNVIDNHMCRTLQTYATGQESLAFLTKFLRKMKDIIGFNSETQKISAKEYRVSAHMKRQKEFTFRTDIFCCDCNAGVKGHLCEHLCAIINAVETEYTTLPSLDESERVFFAKLSGTDLESIKNIKMEEPINCIADSPEADREFEKDFSADDDGFDTDYEPNDDKVDLSTQKAEADNSNDYFVLDVKQEKQDRGDPLEEFLIDDDSEMVNQPIATRRVNAPIEEPKITPEQFKAGYEKSLKELNSEFRRLNKLFKENANRGNLATMSRLAAELAKIRPLERVNLKNLCVELNGEEVAEKIWEDK